MLENSFSTMFFLKTPKIRSNERFVYLRVTVNGTPKEISTKMKWDMLRWNQNTERAIGTKDDAKSINHFLDTLKNSILNYRTELITMGVTVTSERIIDFVKGKTVSKAKVLEEFKSHNDEVRSLMERNEYSHGTYVRYQTTLSHLRDFVMKKYKSDDIEFRDLNYEFIKDFEFYLKTVRECSNNTTLKYIANFRKIVFRAIAKEIISSDPFKLFKGKQTKSLKKPLSAHELKRLENKTFDNERLTIIRDIFVFQCYTGLAYIDAYQLRASDIKDGIDGEQWIISNRQKSKSTTDIPLLPKAIEILEKYHNHPICLERKSALPVRSNQKMNSYLKEIATLCHIDDDLTTHKARRTFASTVTLQNGVPIHIVKEMLGHQSVRQTEEYAITEQRSISKEMNALKLRLANHSQDEYADTENHLKGSKTRVLSFNNQKKKAIVKRFKMIEKELKKLKKLLTK